MTCGGNRAKGPTPPFPPFPPLLEIPQKTRDFHIPTATTTSGLRLTQNRTPKPQKPNPGKIEGLVRFSCRAENSEPAVKNREVQWLHDADSLPRQSAPLLQHVFTHRVKARLGLPSLFPTKRLVLACRSTLLGCRMKCSNSRIRVSFRRRTVG